VRSPGSHQQGFGFDVARTLCGGNPFISGGEMACLGRQAQSRPHPPSTTRAGCQPWTPTAPDSPTWGETRSQSHDLAISPAHAHRLPPPKPRSS
jgi:hypothetical protein